MTIVYKIERNDDLCYIGITNNFKKRLKDHLKSKRFDIGIKTYSILADVHDYHIAEILEEFFIEKYDTYKNGLNTTIDGKGLSGKKFNTLGHRYSEYSKEKMKNNHWSKTGNYSPKGIKMSDEQKKKLSEDRKGRKGNTVLNEEIIREILILYKNKPYINDKIDKIQRNGVLLTYDRAFCNKYGEIYNYTGMYELIRGKYISWNHIVNEILDTKYLLPMD